MSESVTIERPALTMPDTEAARISEAYGAAEGILEYGSGGTTLVAAEMPGKRITSVESDKDWADMMRGWFTQNPPHETTEVDIFWSDIGPTKAWGYPGDLNLFSRFPAYPLEIWSGGGIEAPDVVLIDGRFRVGCALATALNTPKEVRVFIDDYTDRKPYHVIERWFGQPKTTGRLAEWTVAPMTLDPKELLRIMKLMLRPL